MRLGADCKLRSVCLRVCLLSNDAAAASAEPSTGADGAQPLALMLDPTADIVGSCNPCEPH